MCCDISVMVCASVRFQLSRDADEREEDSLAANPGATVPQHRRQNPGVWPACSQSITCVCTNLSWNAPGVSHSPSLHSDCKQLWQKQQPCLKNKWVWSCWETCQSECLLRKHPAGVPLSPTLLGALGPVPSKHKHILLQRWAQTCVRDERALHGLLHTLISVN